MGEGLRVLSHLKGTTDEKIDAIARDVNVELNQGVNNLDAKADKLVKDVKTETAEMRKIIESAEFGIPAPSLASMTAVSDEAGINVTVTATDATLDYSNEKAVLATTKGVMVRYKDGSYPANKEDGELAFIDDDLFTVDTNGNRVAKAKTHLIVGLTKDHTYCFSAFPYTQQGAHNERLGTGNVAKIKWVGSTATLTVNVARDYTIFDLGQVTATLTPTAGGSLITQSRTGDGSIVFGGVKAGNYTLSFNDIANHTKPSNQSIALEGGVPKTVNAKYTSKVPAFSDCSWELIDKVARANIADKYWQIGNEKTETINGESVVLQIYGFNHDQLESGGTAGITLGLKKCLNDGRRMNASGTNSGGFISSEMYSWLNGALFNSFPYNLKSVVKSVNKKTSAGNLSTTINTNAMKVFLFSEIEVFGSINKSASGEGAKYPIFTNNSSRIRTKGPYNYEEFWSLRSPCVGQSSARSKFCGVNTSGDFGWGEANGENGVCFGFCV